MKGKRKEGKKGRREDGRKGKARKGKREGKGRSEGRRVLLKFIPL